MQLRGSSASVSLARGSGGSSAAAIALAFASSGAGIDSFFYTMGNGGWTMAIARMAIVASLAWIAAVAASAFADKTRIGDGHDDDAEKTTCCSGSRKESACDDQPDESNLIVRSLDALVDVLPSIALGICQPPTRVTPPSQQRKKPRTPLQPTDCKSS